MELPCSPPSEAAADGLGGPDGLGGLGGGLGAEHSATAVAPSASAEQRLASESGRTGGLSADSRLRRFD